MTTQSTNTFSAWPAPATAPTVGLSPRTTDVETSPEVASEVTAEPEPGEEAEACVDPAMDLASTALGAWLGSSVIATDRPGFAYSFEVADNQFSPCEELSWVVLSGGTGAPGAPTHDVVLFFAGPDLITEPAPQLLPAGVTVTKHNDGSVTVTRPDGGEATHRLTVVGLVSSGELPEAPRLDFGRAGPPTQEELRPYGNAYTRPWDEERPRGKRYSMAMGQTQIICDFELFNDLQLVCLSPTEKPWPLVTENIPEETSEKADVVILNFQSPWAVSTLAEPVIPRDVAAEALPEDAVTRIDNVFVDTRTDVVKIYDSQWSYVLGDGFAIPADAPTAPLDTSRWPQDLLPWDPDLN